MSGEYLINIGEQISKKLIEKNLKMREVMICFRCSNTKVNRMLNSHSLKTEDLMKWCMLLDYNFFNFYSEEFELRKSFIKKYQKSDNEIL
jgi:hypothetical protein